MASASYEEAFRAGLVALQKGDLALAQSNLESASKLAPQNGRVWLALSQAYWRLQKTDAAEAAATKAESLAPDDPAVLQGLSIYFSETHQDLKAAQAAAKYSPKAPDPEQARQHAGELYFAAAKPLLDRQSFGEAAAILEDGTARLPSNTQLVLALGVAYYGLRRFDEAAGAFLRTIELAPETEQPYAFLARILDQIPGKLSQVSQRFAEYEKAHPENADAFLRHAQALDAQSLDPQTSLGLIDQAIALGATSATAFFERGAVLDRLQRFPEAVAAFERAATLAPSDAATHYRLARDYDRIGKHEAAQAERDKHARLVKPRDTME